MSDEKSDKLEPQNTTELTKNTPVSNEISDDELDHISGGDGANGGAGIPPSTPDLHRSTAKGEHFKEGQIYVK